MTLEDDLRDFLPKCLEKRGDRYYPTEAGCTRLMEWLAERGIHAAVTITDDERYAIEGHAISEPPQ